MSKLIGQVSSQASVSPVRAPGDLDADIYERHAAAVYQQALLMLGDEGLAGQVACAVIVSECQRSPAGPGDSDQVAGRLAVLVLRCCEQLTVRPAAVRDDGGGGDEAREADGLTRALLGLVVYGRLGYREAARELGISPGRAAVLLRAGLLTMPG